MFHVPNEYRVDYGPMASIASWGNNGAFLMPAIIPGRDFCIIASDGMDWEHVSVHMANHRDKTFMPTWKEMDHVKNVFWDEEDTVMQLHPPRSKWVNNHPHTLHLWRPLSLEIPLPEEIMVGMPNMNHDEVKKLLGIK